MGELSSSIISSIILFFSNNKFRVSGSSIISRIDNLKIIKYDRPKYKLRFITTIPEVMEPN